MSDFARSASRWMYGRAGRSAAKYGYYGAKRLHDSAMRSRKRGMLRGTTKRSRRRYDDTMSFVGDRVRTTTAKTVLTQSGNTAIARDHATLYNTACILVARGDDINQRQRDIIRVTGVKVNIEVANLLEAEPVYCNIALVTRKDAPTLQAVPGGFLRGDNSSRRKDLTSALNSIELAHDPINKDRYAVIARKKFMIAPQTVSGASLQDNTHNAYLDKEWYIPINRDFQYDSAPATVPMNSQIYLVRWYTKFDADAGSTQTNMVLERVRTVLHFRDKAQLG